MNVLWPIASHIPTYQSCTISRAWQSVNNSLVARLNRQCICQYSIRSSPQPRIVPAAPARPVTGLRPSPYTTGRFRTSSRRILTRFDELPLRYKDENGLPFRASSLSDAEVKNVLGTFVDVHAANRMMRIIHGRRVAGTLQDPNCFSAYERLAWERGLAWLRQNVPVDEIENAGQRAEKELADMEEAIVSDAERIGIYKPNATRRESVYEEGAFDKIRKKNEKQYEEEQEARKRQKDQAEEIQQNTGTLQNISARSQVELRQPGEHPWLKYYLERSKVLPDMPPEMTPFQRLWPSGLLVLGVMGACILFAQVYTPPMRSARMWPDIPPSAATIITIIGANATILLAWRLPPMFRVLNKFFVSVPGYPRPASLIGNLFSHQTLSHFAINMTVLWFVGTRLHDEIGRGNFLAIYMASGVLGGFVSLTSWVLRANFTSTSLGASGAISGLLATYLLMHSPEKVILFGVFPPENWPSISAMTFLAFIVGIDCIGLAGLRRAPVTVDHIAHLGGYAAGAVSAWLLAKQARERRSEEAERRRAMGIAERIRQGKI